MILAINLVSCAVSYVLLAVTIVMVPGVRAEKTLIIAMSAVIILNSLGMEWLYKAIEKYTYITVRSLIFKTIALAAMFMLVKSKDDYIIYGVLTIAAASASYSPASVDTGDEVSIIANANVIAVIRFASDFFIVTFPSLDAYSFFCQSII